MKKLFAILLLAYTGGFGQKIMDLPLLSGNPAGAFTAVSTGGVTKRYDLGAFLRKIDTTNKWQPKGAYLESEVDPKRVVSVTIAGTTTKTFTLVLADGSNITGYFTDIGSSYTGSNSQYIAGDGSYITFPAIPTNTNQLTNGAGFLTSSLAASTYATLANLNLKLNSADTADKWQPKGIPELDPVWLSEKSNYYNKTQVDAAIAGGGGGVAGVSSWNSRTGAVVPATNDYTFAQIGSKPSSLSGYGITDAISVTQRNADTASLGAQFRSGINSTNSTVAGKQPQLNGTGFLKFSGTIPSYDNSTYVVSNSAITPGVYTKLTVDAKGLVTVGGTLVSADIPTITESQVNNLSADLASKKAANDSGYAKGPSAFTTVARLKAFFDSAYAASGFKLGNESGPGDTIMRVVSASEVAFKRTITGTVTFTGDASTTSFTFPSSVPGISSSSRIFVTARAALGSGVSVQWVDVTTESFIVYFTSAPSSGSKTLNYYIIP